MARSLRALAGSALLFLAAASALQVQLTIRLEGLPRATPRGAKIYVAGSFNGWNPAAAGYRMRAAPGAYTLTLPTAVRGLVEFKFTLGSWESVETDAAGKDVMSRLLIGRTRRVWLYLPPDYHAGTKRYPVIYMHDGQNLFDEATAYAGEWGVDEWLDSRFAAGDPGAIVVGIDNGGTKRLDEYSPWRNERYGGGEGAAYVAFIVETLKPYIDSRHRTLPDRLHTGIAGSSIGGLISLYAIPKYPKVFGRAGAFSPAFWYPPEIFALARSVQPVRPDSRIYLVSGALETAEGDRALAYAEDQNRMYEALTAAGFKHRSEVTASVAADGRHAEWFWRREFPLVYRWLFERR